MFASGYDTKPALSVPIHVVELTNIPPELRPSAYVPLDPKNKDEATIKNVYRDEHKVNYIYKSHQHFNQHPIDYFLFL